MAKGSGGTRATRSSNSLESIAEKIRSYKYKDEYRSLSGTRADLKKGDILYAKEFGGYTIQRVISVKQDEYGQIALETDGYIYRNGITAYQGKEYKARTHYKDDGYKENGDDIPNSKKVPYEIYRKLGK